MELLEWDVVGTAANWTRVGVNEFAVMAEKTS